MSLPATEERETDGRGEYSIWADDYSKPLAIRVCDTDIYVMWHRCGNGSCRRRFASSAACCVVCCFPCHVSEHVGEEEKVHVACCCCTLLPV